MLFNDTLGGVILRENVPFFTRATLRSREMSNVKTTQIF